MREKTVRKENERVPFLTVWGFVLQLLCLAFWLGYGWYVYRYAQAAGWL